ncbi:MAG: hypothetical protein E6G96_15465 [Alphaproteobacteria bacterium]|nr:MAG: hypothetical protein E6G96_15465 [Alphaproteobacteria bacterium]
MRDGAGAARAGGARLKVRALGKAFGATKAVYNVTLDVPPGAFVWLPQQQRRRHAGAPAQA